LAAVLAQPGPVDVPLDDVVPGEPAHVAHPGDRNGAAPEPIELTGRRGRP
jgi:hypothetical protein